MSWMELSLNTTHEAVDWVRTLLAQSDYINDFSVRPYLPEANEPAPVWASTCLIYLPYDRQIRSRVEEIDAKLASLQRAGLVSDLQTEVVEAKLLIGEGDAVYRISDRFLILPPGSHALIAEPEIPIYLNHSLSFGSGFHPATICCLKLIERHTLAGMHTLDLGCGSGILSIAMAKLGAQVLALDNDRVAVQATLEAIEHNQIGDRVTVKHGSLGQGCDLGHWMSQEAIADVSRIEPSKEFDIVVANILARIHVTLAADFYYALRHTQAQPGKLIIAGFTDEYEADVNAALVETGFELIDRESLEEWVGLAYETR